CGLIGPNAVTVLSGKAYWMTPSREFMAYEGGVPFELNSTIGRDVAENLALVQGEKVFAFSNTAFGEVTWLYPDARDGSPAGSGIECSRYASYDTKSGELNIWAPGTYDRTAWIDAGVFPYPLATDTSGNIFYQEKGRSFNGGTFTSSLTTAVIPIGNGNTLFGIRSFFPDFDDQQGGMNLTVITYKEPNSDSTTYGPYAVAANATKVDLGPSYPVGRFAQFKYDAATAPSFLRHGQHQIDVYDTGMVN
ncbi:MAG TPA: hypothetical protein VD994_06430, partial [Prosthecobacter sp.]|nr:hypothetical protein [Prosthecobacter sp.]